MATQSRGLRREDFQIAIICAVSCEYDAVIFAFDEIWDGAEVQLGNAPGDYNKYTVGRIANRNAVLLLLSGMGKVNAASAAVSLRSSYTEIKLAILSGICGGVPGVGTDTELLLGDVIISRCIVQYDLGRRYADRFVTKDTIEDSLGRPHESVRSLTAVFETNSGRDNLQRRTNEILEEIQEKTFHKGNLYQRPSEAEDRLFEPGYLHRHYGSRYCECTELGACEAAQQASCDELQCDSSRLLSRPRHRKRKFLDLVCDDRAHELRIVVGRLGSGDTVMKSGLDRDHIAGEQGLVAFEMEGAGIWDHFPCIVAKAACDYADSHKNKKYQNFAAARAAAASKAILEAFPCIDCPPQSKHAKRSDVVSSTEAVSNIQSATGRDPALEKSRRKLLELLAADHETHKNFNPKRVPGTCEWFLKDQRYREWLESTTSSIIWVSAGPGCGKSVLARTLIDDGLLSTNPTSTTVCYFFFKDGDERRINSHDALSSILHQVFTRDQYESLVFHADHAYKNYGASLRNNFKQLWEILIACASQPESREIVCVIDALDECRKEGREDIFEVLESFYYGEQKRAMSSRLKLLITSRPYDDLEMSFERMAITKSYIRLDGDDKSEEIRHEIDLVIDHKVNEFGRDFHEKHRRAISKKLKAMENRTYLWLHLTLSIIDENPSAHGKPSSVHMLLSRLPSSVDDAYEKILSRIQDDKNEKQARYLFNIILAATRPLTLDEINWALTLQAKDFMNQDEFEDDLWPRERLKVTVKNLCGLFVSVFNEKVSFIHQTAREFLTTTSGLSSTWQGTFDMFSAHGNLFVSCIRLLSLRYVEAMDHDVYGWKTPFVAYAAHNWVLHFNSQESGKRDKFCEAARRLCRTSSKKAPKWAWYMHDQTSYEEEDMHLRNCTDLTLASYLGLFEVVAHMLEKENIEVDSEGGFYDTAIEAAAAAGHLPLVKLLIMCGAGWDIDGERFSMALEVGIIERRLEVAECLLVHRGDPITQEVIIAAAGDGDDRQPIALLIEHARDEVEISGEVMIAAAVNNIGGDDIIAFLLDRCREKVDITEELLEIAASNMGCGDKIISLLLERCEDELDISGRVAEVAAGNPDCGYRIITLFLEEYGDSFSVTPAVIEKATENIEVLSILLEERGHEIEVTLQMITNTVMNRSCDEQAMGLLLENRGDEVEITQGIFVVVAACGFEAQMNFLLEKYEACLELTSELIQAAAGNWYQGSQIMALLLDRYGGEVMLTQETLITAAMRWHSGDSLALLLNRGNSDVKITEEVIVAAASNRHIGPMAFLLKGYGAMVEITEEVILAARKNPHGENIIGLLRENGWDEINPYERY